MLVNSNNNEHTGKVYTNNDRNNNNDNSYSSNDTTVPDGWESQFIESNSWWRVIHH